VALMAKPREARVCLQVTATEVIALNAAMYYYGFYGPAVDPTAPQMIPLLQRFQQRLVEQLPTAPICAFCPPDDVRQPW
jgi:hypothetical protein